MDVALEFSFWVLKENGYFSPLLLPNEKSAELLKSCKQNSVSVRFFFFLEDLLIFLLVSHELLKKTDSGKSKVFENLNHVQQIVLDKRIE